MKGYKTVLIVDDSATIRTLISRELGQAEYRVLTASNGQEALDMIEGMDKPPDLITLDIDMPHMNGFEVCEQLRAKQETMGAGTQPGIPIIFVSGNDTLENRRRGFALEVSDFIVKPFKPKEILDVVDRILFPQHQFRGMTVLVVDDFLSARRVVQMLLLRLGVNVLTASDGIEALELIDSTPHHIDLIITDYEMPRMRGDEFCRIVRQKRHLAQVPLFMVSSHHQNEMILACFKAGATDYLIKPFLGEELLARVDIHLRARKHIRQVEGLNNRLGMLSAVITQSADPIVIFSLDAIMWYVNPAAIDHSGYSERELVGEKVQLLANNRGNQTFCAKIWEVLLGGSTWSDRLFCTRKDGQTIEYAVTISPVRDAEGVITDFIAIGRDMTQINLLQRQLLQAQKLESIGQLAAGIAHEINTPMQYVQNNITFLERAFAQFILLMTDYQRLLKTPEVSLTEEVKEKLEEIHLDFLMEETPESIAEAKDGILRVRKIIAAMKDFSHPGADKKMPTNLNRSLENTITVCRHEWKYVADIRTDFEADLPVIPCWQDQLNQALLNLIVNSAQAIAETGATFPENPGAITISTRLVDNWVEIRVRDTGGGIPQEIEDKIYDPFFTTKEVGKGTGQGLAIVYDVVVRKHGGSVDFISEPEQGTTFIIRLPVENRNSEVLS